MTYNVALCFCPPHKYTPQKNAINSRFVAFLRFLLLTAPYCISFRVHRPFVCLSVWLAMYIVIYHGGNFQMFARMAGWLVGWIAPFFARFITKEKIAFHTFGRSSRIEHTPRSRLPGIQFYCCCIVALFRWLFVLLFSVSVFRFCFCRVLKRLSVVCAT